MRTAPDTLAPALIDKMRQLLKHPAEELRKGIAVSLARFGIHSADSVNLLFDTMNSPTLPIRSRDQAVEALVRIGGESIVDRLTTQLEVDDDSIQTRSLLALIGLNSDAALTGLSAKLLSKKPSTRYFAAAGLAVFVKDENVAAIEALMQALDRETENEPKAEIERVLSLRTQHAH